VLYVIFYRIIKEEEEEEEEKEEGMRERGGGVCLSGYNFNIIDGSIDENY
jgi:hypothetical protein